VKPKSTVRSDGGASGWSVDAATAASAQDEALAKCEKAREAYSSECRLVSVDGEWAE